MQQQSRLQSPVCRIQSPTLYSVAEEGLTGCGNRDSAVGGRGRLTGLPLPPADL